MIVEVIRRYLILGMECSILEIQKLAWFLQRVIEHNHLPNQLKLDFKANYYGPYADNLRLLLNTLDGSYLKSEKRVPDAGPYDVVWVNDSEKDKVIAYLKGDGRDYLPMLEQTTKLVDGFESPFGMELLATVDWLVTRENCDPELSSIKEGLKKWPAGTKWADRKMALFKDVHLQIAIERLRSMIY